MASFEAKTFNATDINNGQKYELGDIVSPNAINAPIEAALLLQALATNEPLIVTDSSGTPGVSINNTPQFVFTNLGGGGSSAGVEERLSEVEKTLASLTYKLPTISSFIADPEMLEIGTRGHVVLLSANITKGTNAFSVSIAGDTTPSVTSYTYSTTVYPTETTTYEAIATDTVTGQTVPKTVTVVFANYKYYGTSTKDGLSSGDFSTLTAELSTKKSLPKRTFSLPDTVTDTDEFYIYYLLPTDIVERLGTPIFKMGDFEGGFKLLDTSITRQNKAGKTVTYFVYRSVEKQTGSIEVTIT